MHNNRLFLHLLITCLMVGPAFADSFKPGSLWQDNNGVPINAHGGGLLRHEGIYYWYGEHKVGGTAGNKAMVGVHCYSSPDLYHWTDEGIALPVSGDEHADIAKGCVLERPKVIYNVTTGKFVMWFHLELKGTGYESARSGVAVSNTPTGPFTYLRSCRPNAGKWPKNAASEERIIPKPESLAKVPHGGPNSVSVRSSLLGRDYEGGQMARDMTLFVDDDGKAYHVYSSEENSTTHIALLSDDYLSHSGIYVRVFPHRWMEAPAICKRNGEYYFLGSGCTGWAPNTARAAVADNILGPWVEIESPCIGVNPQNGLGPEKTFGGQSTFIQKVDGEKDAYIAMFDIWNPKNAIDGRYVWLPMSFNRDRYNIIWKNEWDLSHFDSTKAQDE
ncbi:glycoside hydrolase family 43 protein [Novipirellula herctigrandis]|uniref:glycoside hydrolase family 43 protein n=1 Tax=Novipirellula herctigrandis TaxID=2527986 RepID=UPI003AF37245